MTDTEQAFVAAHKKLDDAVIPQIAEPATAPGRLILPAELVPLRSLGLRFWLAFAGSVAAILILAVLAAPHLPYLGPGPSYSWSECRNGQQVEVTQSGGEETDTTYGEC